MKIGKGYVRAASSIALVVGFVTLTVSPLSLQGTSRPEAKRSRTPVPSVTVTVTVVSNPPRPTTFSLSQNYPNPFNPVTVIEYTLPMGCHVQLTIYNVLGQKVKTLVDQFRNAGNNTVYWNSRDDVDREVASGVYFYVIRAGDFVSVKKMVVVR